MVSTPSAALQYTMPFDCLKASVLSLRVGEEYALDEICRRLLRLGYASADAVEGAGQFSHRGGILDLFVAGTNRPVRMEFFGDEIDRMGYFDPLTQRMEEGCDALLLLPALEVSLGDEARERVRETVKKLISKCQKSENLPILQGELQALDSGRTLENADKYISLIYPERENLCTYFEKISLRTPVLVMGTAQNEEQLEAYRTAQNEMITSLLMGGLVSGKYAEYEWTEDAYERFCRDNLFIHMNPFAGGLGNRRLGGLFGFRCRRGVRYASNFELLSEDLRAFLAASYRVLLLFDNAAAAQAAREALLERDMTAVLLGEGEKTSFDELTAGVIYLAVGHFSSGFELLSPRAAVILPNDDEEYAAQKKKKRTQKRRKRPDAGERILSSGELRVGDYVVHDTHGIGQFMGMETLRSDGILREYITIRYAGTEKLFLPAERLELVSRYIGSTAEDGTVKLSRLGGTEWQRAKQKARRAAEDVAKNLIQLYAARQRKKGFAFPPDSALESEFDDSFAYEETDAQLEAIAEIKADMEKSVPMDRLLCGDVGYGKTEVALRAAFKAVAGGKQVAILVPTTILALQHYQTALSRMRGYAVSIDMISRFRRPKEQAEILRRLKRGDIDIIIGTHSLLGRRVEFKNLGLLIVDEEQRFGVMQKERIKEMAECVDVLTLTATPIPRTLNMAMSGIRDMSLLDEAPGDRYPVQTYVLEHNEGVITEAIRRELGRGGQVLYLYNRTASIDSVAARIAARCPDAHVVFAHGKMEKEELEDIWQEMVNGEIDVLVCTTIIETGVDLPNANTLIIEDADRMGLSQLHQIRGRVGRSGRHAYAYFTYRVGKSLSEIAAKRLQAIREYAGFGAGFRIALRDLELRGAGNLLGAEQHGHIESVGYDMYVRLLNEAVLIERGEALPPAIDAQVSFAGDALIPDRYIASSAHRMEMYKKISLIGTKEDLSDVLDEFCDRFGEPPQPVLRLLYAALCRAYAVRCGISKVEMKGRELYFIAKELRLPVWSELFAENESLRYIGGLSPTVRCRIPDRQEGAEYAAHLLGRLTDIENAQKNPHGAPCEEGTNS
ncbi:MAG: transcription-repair coupling factor [Clostridia bacterium]|nr:transcription-repair coupling factor [Clostridia bacterium]